MSYLTSSFEEIEDALIEALEGEGFSFDPLTTTLTEYLSTALGSQDAYLRKSLGRLLSDLDAQYGGSLSHLTSPIAQLMDDVAANIGAGGGGEEGYVAQAVHFDDNNSLITIDAAGSDQSQFLFSVWIGNTRIDNSDDNIPLCSYPNGMLEFAALYNLNPPGEVFTSPLTAWLYASLSYDGIQMNTDTDIYPISGWKHIAYSLDLNHADPDKRLQLYIDAVAVACTLSQNNEGAMTVALSEETAFKIGYNGVSANYGIFDCADLQFWSGTSADLSVAENLAKFISSGKPVDPAEATTAFGAQSILLSGDATGFAVNHGNLGTASLAGSLTNASTSPSD